MNKCLKVFAVIISLALFITAAASGCKMSFDDEDTDSEEVRQESKSENLSVKNKIGKSLRIAGLRKKSAKS